MTDIEASTQLWDRVPEAMRDAMVRHDEVIDEVVSAHGGHNHKPRGEGDSRFVVFSGAPDAVAAAAEIQRRVSEEPWSTPDPIRIRIGIHTGHSDLRDGDYFGTHVNRAARIRGLAHGGQTVLSRATADLVVDALPDEISLIDLGEHRLAGLSRPEVVHQLVVEGLPWEFPPLVSPSAPSKNLPVQATPLIGRDAEVARIEELLGEHRLVTIHAAGGTGKTRVAIEVAASVARRFSDGIIYVSLAPVSDFGGVPAAIADVAGFPLAGASPEVEQVLDYLRKKNLLLVLDNFEHVRAAAPLVSRTLAEAPEVRILVTSRERINVSGEAAFSLSGLSWTGSGDAGSAALQLFIDAARRRLPDWELAETDSDAIDRILTATQGMPLAVILAAAWVDMMPVAEIADEVTESVDFFETEDVDVPDRHRSVRAVFDYSWRLLSEPDRQSFARLSVFRGGFTRQAASGVAGASMRDLARLVSKSLVVADPKTGRYVIHELLRQLGEESLSQTGRLTAAQDAYAEWMSGAAGALDTRWCTGDQVAAIVDFGADVDNFRAAWTTAVERRQDLLTRSFLNMFFFHYDIRGDLQRAVEHFAESADALENRGDEHSRLIGALCRGVQAWFVGLQGEFGQAVALHESVEPVVDRLGDREDRAMHISSGIMNRLQHGDHERIVADVQGFVAEAEVVDTENWPKYVADWEGYALVVQGDFEGAWRAISRTMERAQRLNQRFELIWMHESIAMMHRQAGDVEQARREVEQSLAYASEFGHARAIGYSVGNLGELAEELGDVEEAMIYRLHSLAFADEVGQVAEVLSTLGDIARLRLAAGEGVEALRIVAAVLTHPNRGEGRRFAEDSAADIANRVIDAARKAMPASDVDAVVGANPPDSVEVIVKELLVDTEQVSAEGSRVDTHGTKRKSNPAV